MSSQSSSSKWADLAPRLLSAAGMAAIAVAAIWIGGTFYFAMIIVVIGMCMWEFARLLNPTPTALPIVLGLAASGGIFLSSFGSINAPGVILSPQIAALFLAPVMGAILANQYRVLFFAYGLLIMLAGLGFLSMGPGDFLGLVHPDHHHLGRRRIFRRAFDWGQEILAAR